jgi:geranylgeranyl diphosphate synthase type II
MTSATGSSTSASALRELVEAAIAKLELTPDLRGQAESMRYALAGGGKRVRPVICLATAEAAGASAEAAMPAALALELVHTFSLVHDDLPCMDDDDERRGRPSTHVAFPEGVALLAGDGLMTEAMILALRYETPEVARELAVSTQGMIGGQFLDITGAHDDLAELHRLKTGRLFAASVGLALWVAGVPRAEQGPWRAFSEELGLLFQIVDDVLDGDGYAATLGPAAARQLAHDVAEKALAQLAAIPADTSVLAGIVRDLAVRTV